jgi:hypothetical protein
MKIKNPPPVSYPGDGLKETVMNRFVVRTGLEPAFPN